MSATNNPNTPAPSSAPIPTPPYAPNPTDYTYTWGQISAGPQAIAFKAVMQLAGLLTQIMDMYNQQAATQLTVQSQAAKAGSDATIAAAKDQSYQTAAEAASSFANAGVSIAGVAYTGMNTDYKPLNTANENKAGLDELQKSFTEVKIAPPAGGSASTIAPGAPSSDPRVQARIAELLSGGKSLVTASKSTETVEVGPTLPGATTTTLTKAALEHMAQNGQLDQFSEKLTSAQDNNAKEINNWYTAHQTQQSQTQMYQGILTGAVSGASQTTSAVYQQRAGQEQATATLANSNAQQAGSMASTSQGLISKFYDEELQAYSMLQQIAATATVRG